MDIELLEKMQKDTVRGEKTCGNINSLNKYINNKNDLIMHINIRSISPNINKLKILLNSLTRKPAIVICTATFIQENFKMHELEEYNSYYNESKINQNDGVIFFVHKNIEHENKTVKYGNIKIINTHIRLNDNNSIELSASYRSHNIPKTEFILDLNRFLNKKRNIKNHLVIGDFNIVLLQSVNTSQEFLCNFLDKGFFPGFVSVTRPTVGNCKGSCTDNIFIKTNSLSTVTYKLKHSVTDHYPIFIAINKMKTQIKAPIIILDYKKLRNIAKTIDWNDTITIRNPNIATDKILREIKYCIELAKIKKRENKQKGRKNGITDAIIKSWKPKNFYITYGIWI